MGFPTGQAMVSYRRVGGSIHIETHVGGREFRTLLLGLWSSMPEEERKDFINELKWYVDRMNEMPDLSLAIMDVLTGTRSLPEDEVRYVDWRKMKRAEYGEDE